MTRRAHTEPTTRARHSLTPAETDAMLAEMTPEEVTAFMYNTCDGPMVSFGGKHRLAPFAAGENDMSHDKKNRATIAQACISAACDELGEAVSILREIGDAKSADAVSATRDSAKADYEKLLAKFEED